MTDLVRPLLGVFRRDFQMLGRDQIGDIAGFVVNSSLLKAPAKVQADAAKMEAWLSTELAKAKRDGVKHLLSRA